MIAYDLDLHCSRTSKTEVLFALNSLLLQQANEGRTTVLIVDEAHNLNWEVLEEIRMLGNLENAQRQTAPDHPGRAARAGSQAGSARSAPAQAAHRASLWPAAVQPERNGQLHQHAAGPGGHAGSERCSRRS